VNAGPGGPRPIPNYRRRSVDEVLADPRILTVDNVHGLAMGGIFESDAELDDFLQFYRAQRCTSVL